MQVSTVRTRFAPSPTGPLHMGGVRTALFNFLFARKHGGKFLLRIEDTDLQRYVPGAEEYIIEALNWCGIQIDEGVSIGGVHEPYRQSERKELGIYGKYAAQMVEKGHAYYAFDTSAEIEGMRDRLLKEGHSAPQYNHETRLTMSNSLTVEAADVQNRINSGQPYVIRLKVNPGEQISFTDLIRGEVSFNSTILDDKVLLKSDGMPTYHLAHIIDDVLMEITHAIRGEEWLPSAPAHILIYRYLGWESKMPVYAHLPLLLKPDGNGKLSKRDGDRLGFPVFPLNWTDPVTGEVSTGYRERGYYPEAFVNMLAFLGWNPGSEKELFSMEELIEAFSFEHVHKAGARFDPEKARWFNEQYLRRQPTHQLAAHLKPRAERHFGMPENDRRLETGYLEQVVELLKERVQFEEEFLSKGESMFITPAAYDEPVIKKKWKTGMEEFFKRLADEFSKSEIFDTLEIDALIRKTAELHQLKPGEIMQLLRVIVSGAGSGADLLGMIKLLGKEEVCHRIEKGLEKIRSMEL